MPRYFKLINEAKPQRTFKIVNATSEELIEGNWPKRYRSEFIEPGVISYEDVGEGVVLVGKSALDKMLESFIGKPVVNEVHHDLTPDEAYKLSDDDLSAMADGVVYDVGVLDNGWYYCDMIVWNEETQKNIEENGYSVSCAYTVTAVDKGGEYHGVTYNEEVTDGFYTHNAIVSNPRYERAKIYELTTTLQNSKADEVFKIYKNSKGEKDMAKIFKFLNNSKKQNAQEPDPKESKETPEEDTTMNMEGAYIVVDGKKIPLEEAVNAYENMNQEPETTELGPDEEVSYNGKTYKVSELMSACGTGADKENAEPAQDVIAVQEVEEQPSSSANSKHNSKPAEPTKTFTKVKTAVKKVENSGPKVETKYDRYNRGASRYGSAK